MFSPPPPPPRPLSFGLQDSAYISRPKDSVGTCSFDILRIDLGVMAALVSSSKEDWLCEATLAGAGETPESYEGDLLCAVVPEGVSLKDTDLDKVMTLVLHNTDYIEFLQGGLISSAAEFRLLLLLLPSMMVGIARKNIRQTESRLFLERENA